MLPHIEQDELKDKHGRPASPSYFEELSKNVSWYHKVLLNRPLKVAVVWVLLCLVLPPMMYLFYYQNIYMKTFIDDGYSLGICSHSEIHRVQCTVDMFVKEMRDCPQYCCYDTSRNTCYHTVPSRYSYLSNGTWHEGVPLTPRVSFTPYGADILNRRQIQLHVREVTVTHVNFVLYDPSRARNRGAGPKVSNTTFSYRVYFPEIQLEIFSPNKSIARPLLSTARGALVSAEGFWEWSFIVSDEQLYGLGGLLLEPKVIYNSENESNSYPFVLGQRNGSFHGILFESSGPLVLNLTKSMVLTAKSLAGDDLGVHFFYGPSPKEVLTQYLEYIGGYESPPFWSLGVHFCRGNASSSVNVETSLQHFYNFSKLAIQEGVPYDSDCIADGLLDFVNTHISAEDQEGIARAVEHLSNNSISFLPTLRPHILVSQNDSAYTLAVMSNILLVSANSTTNMSSIYQGMLPTKGADNVVVSIPDYSLENATSWLKQVWPYYGMTNSFVVYDSWPRVLAHRSPSSCTWEHFYFTQAINKTVCETAPWNLESPASGERHINNHNSYAKNYVDALNRLHENATDSFVMADSSSAGTAAATFQQNVPPTWASMRREFHRAVWAGVQGNWMHGVPLCGSLHTTTASPAEVEALCIKWYLASMFLPVVRIHSNIMERHPFAFSGFARTTMTYALKTRYKLLPYFYGEIMTERILLRPMFYEYPGDKETYKLQDQFLVGKSLVVAPNFSPASIVSVYIPDGEKAYDLWGGEEIPVEPDNWVKIPTLETEVVALVLAGHVLPLQEETFSTALETRETSAITLIAALNCDEGGSCGAEGYLYVSQDNKMFFKANKTALQIDPWQGATIDLLCGISGEVGLPSSIIDRIRVYGLDTRYNSAGKYYQAHNLSIDVCRYPANAEIVHVYSVQ